MSAAYEYRGLSMAYPDHPQSGQLCTYRAIKSENIWRAHRPTPPRGRHIRDLDRPDRPSGDDAQRRRRRSATQANDPHSGGVEQSDGSRASQGKACGRTDLVDTGHGRHATVLQIATFIGRALERLGGHTRARTWDPLSTS